jgi:hypothetical protein
MLIQHAGSTTDVSIWSSVEPGIGLVAISLPALRPLFASIFNGLTTSGGTAERTRSKHYGNSARPAPNVQHKYWDDDDDGLQLRGLPRRMGHTVSIEGGIGRKQGPSKLQKSPDTMSRKSPKSPRSRRSSGEAYEFTITRTDDFKHWSGNESTLVSLFL